MPLRNKLTDGMTAQVAERPKAVRLPKIETQDIAHNVVWQNLGIRIADHYAQLGIQQDTRKAKTLSEEDILGLMQRVSDLQSLITDNLAQNDTANFEALKKLINQQYRTINQIGEKREVPFGEKTESLIFIIAKQILRELADLRRTNPEQYNLYNQGQDTRYWFTTYTSSLNTMLNRNEMGMELATAASSEKRKSKKFNSLTCSFRGEKGFYSGLQDSGFVLEKEVTNNKVRLCIDLEWLFGFQINILQDPSVVGKAVSDSDEGRGLSTGLSQNSLLRKDKQTEYNESGVASLTTLLSAAMPPVTVPTNVGKSLKAEGEVEVVTSTVETATVVAEKEKAENSAPRAKPENNQIAFDYAKDSSKLALKLIFNPQMVKTGRIMYNETSNVTEITNQDVKDMPFWMFDLYQYLKLENENWGDVAALVNEAIENTAKYQAAHPTWKTYHPRFWLNPSFSGGCLRRYIETFLRDRPEPTEKPLIKPHTPQILWVLENGGDRDVLMHYVRKHGETLVSSAIAFAGVRKARGFEPTNGMIPYIFGILKNLNPATIQGQMENEKGKLAGKAPKLQGWTVGKITKMIGKMVLTDKQFNLFTPSVVEAITAYAAEKKVEKPQVDMWLEAIAQGKKTKFN
jgi:hypothetical protein